MKLNQIELLSLKLEWIPTDLVKQFVTDILEQYYYEAGLIEGMIPIDVLIYEIGPGIVEALSWIKTEGETTDMYWRDIKDYPAYGQTIYNNAVESVYDNAFNDIKKILDFYHMTYVEVTGFYTRNKMQHYSVEVW